MTVKHIEASQKLLHVTHDGETLTRVDAGVADPERRPPTEFEVGFLIGILVGEGHFGGDGRNAQVTLRMHTRHEQLFRWLLGAFGGRLYGPYDHGGRKYFQWMVRGRELREQLVPLLASRWAFLDDHIRSRVETMCERYSIPLIASGLDPGS